MATIWHKVCLCSSVRRLSSRSSRSMAQTRSLLRAAATPDATPAAVLRQANAYLRALTTSEMFATAVYATLAVPSGGLKIARAGLLPTLVTKNH